MGIEISVKQVVKEFRNIIKNYIVFNYLDRRLKHLGSLIVVPSLAKSLINCNPKYSDLNIMIKSAWKICNSIK